jgi:predicted NBD/HSP70 family sugar kinase
VRGESGAAGEFGHVSWDDEGPACGCGGRGCWEAYASNSAAIKNYNYGISKNGAHRNKAQTHASVSGFNDLLLLAEGGDVTAGEVLDRMAYYLGIGIAMLINALAPSIITIVGEVTRVWGRINPIVQRVVQERARTHAGTRVVPSDNSTQPRLRGTVALVLEKHFQPQLVV